MKIEFFRKRSGKIVKFNPEKIRSAVSRAIAEADAILPKPLPENLDLYIKDKVLFLLNYEDSEFYVKPDTVGSRIPKLEDVQDAVEYSLQRRWQDRPAGYGDVEAKLLHDLYANYRKEREKARAALRVVRKEKSKVDVTDKGMLLQEGSTGTLDGWDRSRLEKDLEDVLPDSEKAPVIAKRVERAILKSGLRTVSSDLVTEMANNELTAMGIPARLNSGRGYFVDKDFIDGLMYAKSRENSNVTSNNPEAINMAMSEYLLKNWAFDNVFSKDVVHAHQFGLIYLHDLGSITKVYCSSHSIEYLKKYGLRGLVNLNTQSKPARSASVLTGHINTFLASMQAYYAGALGLGYVNVFYAPYLTGKTDKELHQIAQEFIFNCSQNAFSRGAQSLFIDANICTGIPKALKDTPAIGPGGKYQIRLEVMGAPFLSELMEEGTPGTDSWHLYHDWNGKGDKTIVAHEEKGSIVYDNDRIDHHVMRYSDYEEEAQRFANALLDVWGEGDANGHIFEFPKCDFHVCEETFSNPREKRVYDHACEVAAKNGSVYFVFDRESYSTSACCFTGDTKVLVKGGVHGHVQLLSFAELSQKTSSEIKMNLCAYHNGGWSRSDLLVLSGKDKPIYEIVTTNKKRQKVTCDHIVPTLRGDVRADEVTTDDYILFSTSVLQQGRPNACRPVKNLTYEQGVLIGAYLGDGSIEQKNPAWTPTIHFSLNEEKFNRLKPIIDKALEDWGINEQLNLRTPYNNVYPAHVDSKELKDRIREWVSGSYGYEKNINLDCLRETDSFRRGIIDGYYITDGGNSNRIYTTSVALIDSMEVIFTSLGIQTVIDKSDRTGDGKVVIRGEEFNRNFPVYCIRWYSNGTRRQYPGIFLSKNNSIYYKVTSVEKLPPEETVYCFQVKDNNEPYFTLPSGVITHNCRLRISLDKALFIHPESARSCGFQNVTINLPQCSYRTDVLNGLGDPKVGSPTWESFIGQVDAAMDLAVKAHLQKKKHIAKLMSGPDMPLWQIGKPACDGKPYIDLDKCVYIIGLIGLDDACRRLFGKSMHEDEELTTWGLSVIAHMDLRVKEYSKEYGLSFTLEESPAESAARRLARSDLAHFPTQAKDIVNGSEGNEYYTNSIHIPADADVPAIERIQRQAMFHGMIDSGAMTHLFIGEESPSAGAISYVVEQTFRLTQSAQITFSPEFTYCNVCGNGQRGLYDVCNVCGSHDVFGETRVVGYFSKIQNWNRSKRYGELVARHRGNYSVKEADK